MSKKSNPQKQVERLKLQLSGKILSVSPKPTRSTKNPGFTLPQNIEVTPNKPITLTSDTHYLRRDMIKIGVLSSAAILIQLVLFFAQRNNLGFHGF